MKRYRFLSAPDTKAFCDKVTGALNDGWTLYGSPTQAWDHEEGVMRCGQAVIKDESDAPEAAGKPEDT